MEIVTLAQMEDGRSGPLLPYLRGQLVFRRREKVQGAWSEGGSDSSCLLTRLEIRHQVSVDSLSRVEQEERKISLE